VRATGAAAERALAAALHLDRLADRRRELTRLWNAYSVRPQREDLEHTARLVLVDPKGIQRVSFPLDQLTPERLAHDLRLLADGH